MMIALLDRKMARIVCILIPLFGVPDIIFVFLSFWFDVEYLYAEMFFNSLQVSKYTIKLFACTMKKLENFVIKFVSKLIKIHIIDITLHKHYMNSACLEG